MKVKVTIDTDENVPGSLRNAVSQEGAIIFIDPKIKEITLKSELVIQTDLKIISWGNLILKAGPRSRLIRVDKAKRLTLIGLTLTGGKSERGGAILVQDPENTLILEGCQVTRNVSVRGGGIYSRGKVILRSSSVDDNLAYQQGGGIWTNRGLNMYSSTLNKNRVNHISSTNIGGGLVVEDGNLIMYKSTINKNRVKSSLSEGGAGGGVYMVSGQIFLSESEIDNNSAYTAGGVQIGVGNVQLLDYSSISENKSFASGDVTGGGGISITYGNVTLEKSTISNNKTQGMFSGGIVSALGNVTVLDSILEGNENSGPGGAIACNFDSVVTLSRSKLANNKGASLGGAIVNFAGATGQITIDNSSIVNNTLTNQQTIGQTITAFLGVLLQSLDHSQAVAATTKGSGADKLIGVLPRIAELAQKTSGILSSLPDFRDSIGGSAIATLLTCPVSISGETQIKGNVAVGEAASYGAIFSIASPVVVSNSLIVKNVTQNANAILSIGQLMGNRIQVDGEIDNRGLCTVTDSLLTKIKNEGDLTLIKCSVGSVESTNEYIQIK